MPAINIKLKNPINIDAAEIAKFFPEFSYINLLDIFKEANIVNQNDGRYQRLLGFCEKNALGYNLIVTEFEPIELAVLLRRLPDSLLTPLMHCFAESEFSLPTPSTQQIATVLKKIANDEKKFGVITRVLSKEIHYKAAAYQRNEVLYVQQRQIALTNSTNKLPVLVSAGAYECVLVAAYNKFNQSGALAHVDSVSNLSNLIAHIKSLRTTIDEKIIFNLAGGTSASSCYVDALIRALSEIPNAEIESAELYQSGRDSDERRLSIDTRNGAVARSIPTALLATNSTSKEINFLETQLAVMSFTHEEQKAPLQLIYTHKTLQAKHEEKSEIGERGLRIRR